MDSFAPKVEQGYGETTNAPLLYNDASIGNALGSQGSVESVYSPSTTPENRNPPNAGGQLMETLLGGSSNQNTHHTPVSEESRMIVAGIVESFMHKQHLLPGEKRCLEDSVSQITGDVVGTGKDVVYAIKGFMNGGAGQRDVSQEKRTKSQGTVVSSGIDAALKLTSLVTAATSLVKNCVQGDALRMLNETAHHLIDMKYLGHRLVVSGVDIAHALADSIISYEKHEYHRFGKDIGSTLRKILLSSSSRGSALPEGVPEEEIIQKTTEGLMDGFFVGGSSMEITDSVRPDVDIQLDLHRCIAGNQVFFKEIFLALWNAIAQFSANKEQHGLGGIQGGTPKWTSELMIALMQLPAALERCDIDPETQGMLMESIQTLGDLKVHLAFPKGRVSIDEISHRMAKAVESWTEWHFKQFGENVGVMLREFVLMVYPMKYSVDENGRLRRQLSSLPRVFKADGLAIVFVGMMSMAAIALAAVRRLRGGTHQALPDMEEADAELAAEQLIENDLIE
jgi:hypothetical protein